MLTKQQKSIIIEAMKPFCPTKIGVFGSVARDEENVHSDIDLLYSFNGRCTLMDLSRLKNQLEVSLDKKVDLISFSFIHPFIKDKVLRDTKMLLNEERWISESI